MIFKLIKICYEKSHGAIQVDGPEAIQNVNSQQQASKLIRAVLRGSGIEVEGWREHSIHRCYCGRVKGEGDGLSDLIDPFLKLDDLQVRDGDTVFIRKMSRPVETEDRPGELAHVLRG